MTALENNQEVASVRCLARNRLKAKNHKSSVSHILVMKVVSGTHFAGFDVGEEADGLVGRFDLVRKVELGQAGVLIISGDEWHEV